MREIAPAALAARLGDASRPAPLLLDVREDWEFAYCHIDGSMRMPMGGLPSRLSELDPARETVVICHHGVRSAQVCLFLQHQGFDSVLNLAGGVAGWADEVDPSMPRY